MKTRLCFRVGLSASTQMNLLIGAHSKLQRWFSLSR